MALGRKPLRRAREGAEHMATTITGAFNEFKTD
ncbi:MAG: hypothetical protein XU10_C0029G0001, partial [Chloroflexi bacterium CSP1-4]